MTITVNIGDADLNELLAKLEAGEDVVLTRDGVPMARLTSLAEETFDREARMKVLEEVKAFRDTMPRVTQEEIAEWKAIGRR
ncbi:MULTISPECIES: type II toxin-antitoxin system Phd/YefM family antitoxin [Rhizobiaceae]|jgi:antitoxin (DNA-binding transcriptional repressor) of toxin-antitoxin stability system|uniref:Antitoxin (DNA-binding transcriptional repressor) of toxin-antitoxin stability system n=1 Tax=Aliirhizobium cellulosilyticum TaxID=393664 RepID=A0A7W6SAY8_9HYPH|nr:type II toxin-antitoxin system prevent-host-death family antitoxin [Rhizobium cellulosilyticum]MBB4350437.1 antitoxin (DNA-binding transcriptional repressor) of toxin-antitoxin stability system [Rhizobium cellulosilyticum]MBB4413531.1 antitoxin (DNA-binding transcriptional repressor) of toxin-antitoxin stability system [Rhizobium cellulosilyticum]MBB4448164.1 antitoxin (DNA-binding transcriptional repressor) of toxin-antitoxin stability system [Rhizobium cellulosilyticum]